MGADLVRFIIRFDEHEPTGKWKDRKFEIADFIAKCWNGDGEEEIKRKEKALAAVGFDYKYDCDYEQYEYDDTHRYFEMECPEFYGHISLNIIRMKEGMAKFFPDVDYEFHYYEWYGDVTDEIHIVIGGEETIDVEHGEVHSEDRIIELPGVSWTTPKFKDGQETVTQDAEKAAEVKEKTGMEKLIALAEAGDPRCQLELSNVYFDGDEETDYKASYEWALKAAEQGYAPAMSRIATFYSLGEIGIEPDYDTAMEWLKKAADSGDEESKNDYKKFTSAEGIFDLALMCMNLFELKGKPGVDFIIDLCRRAAELGHAKAQYTVGVAYVNNSCKDADYEKGIEWLKKSAAQGEQDAVAALEKNAHPIIHGKAEPQENDTEKTNQNNKKGEKEMEFKATRIIAEALEAKGVICRTMDNDEMSAVIIPANEDGIKFEIRMISNSDNNDVNIYTDEFVSYPENKRNNGLKQINDLNGQYRFVKFVMDPADGAVHLECFIPMSIGDSELPNAAEEMLLRLVITIKDAYPQIMKTIWT